jgi:hypothetical protein
VTVGFRANQLNPFRQPVEVFGIVPVAVIHSDLKILATLRVI